jgi:transposase
VPPEEVGEFKNLFPPACENCWAPLPQTPGSSAQRFQTLELPPLKPDVTEWVRHCVECPKCNHRTWASPAPIPTSPFGPRLSAVIGLLTGVYHLSRRSAVGLTSDVLGIDISLGAVSAVEERVSEAVKPAVEESWAQAGEAPVKHTDGTSWFQAGVMCSLWTIATSAVTVFKILADGKAATLAPLFGKKLGILVSDRATALNFWAMERRQICWAHLLRKAISFSERAGPAGSFGRELLDYIGILFDYWGQVRAGQLSREAFRERMAPVRLRVEALLERGRTLGLPHVSGSCEDILFHRRALWTFVDLDGVEPTNNHAERELRAFVLWRKRSFGTQSARGNLFAERLMTVAHTARKQHKNVLEFLTDCCTAARTGATPPSLFAAA